MLLFLNWRDCSTSDPNWSATFALDGAKKDVWKAFKEEVYHICLILPPLIHIKDENYTSHVSLKDIYILVLGSISDYATLFYNNLAID